MGFALSRYHPVAQVMIVGLPAAIVLALLYQAIRRPEPRLPTDVGSVVTTLTTCPSDPDHDAWVQAAMELAGHGLYIDVRRGACDGPPAVGEAQARRFGDFVEGYTEDLGDGTVEQTVSHGRPVESAVVYLEPGKITPGTRRGALLHVLGIGLEVDGRDGHADSGVLDREHSGMSWRLVDLVVAKRGER